MVVRRDRPGPPAGKDFDPEHYYNLWRYVTRFIRYSDLGQALVVTGGASGTSTTGTLTLAVSGSGSGGGGFGTIVAVGDVLGTSTTGTLTAQVGTIAGPFRVGTGTIFGIIDPTEPNGIVLNILNGTGVNGANLKLRGTGAAPSKYIRAANSNLEVLNNAYGAVLLGINDAGTATAVAFGAGFSQWGTESAGFVSGGTGTFASIRGGDLGTMARFASYTVAGDALGTSTTATMTLALATTGVTAGTYGTGGTMVPQVTVDAKGRLLAVSEVGISFPAGGGGTSTATWTGAVLGTGTLPGGPIGMEFTPNPNFTGTGTAVGWSVTGTATAGALKAANVIAGAVGSPLDSVLLVTGLTPSVAASFALRNLATVSPSVTAAAYGNISQIGVAGTSTLGALIHYMASPVAFGTLAGVGVQYGFVVESNLTGGTSNYGFYGNIGTGTNRFNFFANGGAPNAFAGFSRFGGITAPTVAVDVTGNVRATGTGTFAALQGGTSTGGFSRWGTSSQTLVQGASASFTGTGTYGGVLSTRALSGAVGSSATRANAVIGPYVNGVPVSITTVAGTLMGYGIPASAITGSGQGLEFSMWGTIQFSPVVGGMIVKLGTATLINGTSTVGPGAWVVEGQIVGQASAQQQFFTRFAAFTNDGVGIEQINVGTLGMNLSTVTTLCLAGTGTNSNARQQNGMTVKFMGLQ